MRGLLKWLWRLLAGLASACAAIILVLAALINTQWGLHWTYGILRVIMPGTLTIADMQGRLSGPLMLFGVEYQTDDLTLKVQHFQLDWVAAALFDGTLHIEHLQIIGVDVHSSAAAASEPSQPVSLPDVTFPVNVIIDHATLMDMVATTATEAPPVRLDALSFSAYTRNDTLNINSLHIATDTYTADMSGFITPAGVYPFELRAEWSTPHSPLGRMAGRGQLHGNLQRISFDHDLLEPAAVAARGTITEPLGELRWKGEVSVPDTSLQALRPDWPALTIAMTANGSGDLRSAQTQGTATTRLPSLTLTQRFDAHYEADTLTLHELLIRVPDQAGQVRVHGTVQLADQPLMKLNGEWKALRWPLAGTTQVESHSGQARFSGTPQAYEINAKAQVSGPQIPPGTWTLAARGNERELNSARVEGAVLGGRLNALGNVQWLPTLQWTAQLSGEELDPSTQWPEWPGQLRLSAHSAGALEETGLAVSAEISELAGQLKDYPLAASMRLSLNPQGVEVHALDVASGDNRMRAHGVMNEQWFMDWEINARQIEQLYPALSGAARGSGQLRGSRAAPILTMSAAGQGLRFQEHSSEEITVSAALDLTDETPSTIVIEASKLRVAGQQAAQLSLRGEGTSAQHSLSATLGTTQADVDLSIMGAYLAGAWQGAIQTVEMNTRTLGQWRLGAAAPVEVSQDKLSLAPLCLREQHAELCAQGGWSAAGGWAAHVQVERIPLHWVQQWLPENTALEGEIMAMLSASQAPELPLNSHLVAQAGPGAFSFAPDQQEPVEVAYTSAQLVARVNPFALLADLEMPLSNGGTIIANVTVPRRELPALLHSEQTPQSPLQGHARLVLPDLGVLPAFISGVENTRGSLSAALRLKGSVGEPRVSGEVNLNDGSAALPGLGINIEAINARILSDERGRIKLRAQVHSRNILTLEGDAFHDTNTGWHADMRVRGANVEVVRTPEYRALVSPDMRIRILGQRIDLEGEVIIPEANIRPRDLSAAAHASDDVVLVTEELTPSDTTARWEVFSQLRVRLGNFVRFNGFGLRARLGGDLMLLDAPSQPTTARGELRVDEGEYRAYGQKLTVERGRLLFFGGTVDNPGLDVRAVRHVPEHNVTAGVLVRGPIKAPRISIFSDPAMAETDALSFLLLGRPMNQASSAEGEQLYGAATSLGLAGGGLLATQIGRRFGIEDVRIESGGGFGEGALVIRHYLSPRLYISYGIGLFEHFNVFLMRYQINRLWALEAETGVNSGADIIYTLDKD